MKRPADELTISWGEAVEKFIDDRIASGKSPRTLARYRYQLAHFHAFVQKNPHDVTRDDIVAFLKNERTRRSKLTGTLQSHETISVYARALFTFFKWSRPADAADLVTADDKKRKDTLTKRATRFVTPEDMEIKFFFSSRTIGTTLVGAANVDKDILFESTRSFGADWVHLVLTDRLAGNSCASTPCSVGLAHMPGVSPVPEPMKAGAVVFVTDTQTAYNSVMSCLNQMSQFAIPLSRVVAAETVHELGHLLGLGHDITPKIPTDDWSIMLGVSAQTGTLCNPAQAIGPDMAPNGVAPFGRASVNQFETIDFKKRVSAHQDKVTPSTV